MANARPNSIRHRGLQAHLDETRDQHKGRGYSEFEEYVGLGLNRRAIATLFNVNFKTASKWLQIYQEVKVKHGTSLGE